MQVLTRSSGLLNKDETEEIIGVTAADDDLSITAADDDDGGGGGGDTVVFVRLSLREWCVDECLRLLQDLLIIKPHALL